MNPKATLIKQPFGGLRQRDILGLFHQTQDEGLVRVQAGARRLPYQAGTIVPRSLHWRRQLIAVDSATENRTAAALADRPPSITSITRRHRSFP